MHRSLFAVLSFSSISQYTQFSQYSQKFHQAYGFVQTKIQFNSKHRHTLTPTHSFFCTILRWKHHFSSFVAIVSRKQWKAVFLYSITWFMGRRGFLLEYAAFCWIPAWQRVALSWRASSVEQSRLITFTRLCAYWACFSEVFRTL